MCLLSTGWASVRPRTSNSKIILVTIRRWGPTSGRPIRRLRLGAFPRSKSSPWVMYWTVRPIENFTVQWPISAWLRSRCWRNVKVALRCTRGPMMRSARKSRSKPPISRVLRKMELASVTLAVAAWASSSNGAAPLPSRNLSLIRVKSQPLSSSLVWANSRSQCAPPSKKAITARIIYCLCRSSMRSIIRGNRISVGAKASTPSRQRQSP